MYLFIIISEQLYYRIVSKTKVEKQSRDLPVYRAVERPDRHRRVGGGRGKRIRNHNFLITIIDRGKSSDRDTASACTARRRPAGAPESGGVVHRLYRYVIIFSRVALVASSPPHLSVRSGSVVYCDDDLPPPTVIIVATCAHYTTAGTDRIPI